MELNKSTCTDFGAGSKYGRKDTRVTDVMLLSFRSERRSGTVAWKGSVSIGFEVSHFGDGLRSLARVVTWEDGCTK